MNVKKSLESNAIFFEQTLINKEALTFKKEENGSLKVIAWAGEKNVSTLIFDANEINQLKEFINSL